MRMRQRKRVTAYLSGVMLCLVGLLILRRIYDYFSTRHLLMKLRPGEHLVLLGGVNIDEVIQQDKPDVGSAKLYAFSNSSIDPGRKLPDTRPGWCGPVDHLMSLPATSVVMVIHDEPRTVIIRTLYSVLLRTPPNLLQEIIIVDDNREDASFGKVLSKIPKVTVTRNSKQEGLVRSCNVANNFASAPVLTFLSAKCEVNVNWLEPMLRRLAQNPAAVVSPVLDKISPSTGEYSASAHEFKAGFDWSLMAKWEEIDSETLASSSVISSPIYRGHVFGIRKDRFNQLGKFDPDLDLYGAENLELSFKTWLCGGSVEILPCSRVGQLDLEREISGVPRGKENIYMKNAKRVAEVWMDDYKRFYYHTKPTARMLNAGNTLERKSLRSHLKCRNFKWYLDNVYPQLRLPVTDEVMYGNIRQLDLCVDIEIGHVPAIAKLSQCNVDRGTQDWSFKKKGEITNGGMCLAADSVETHGYVMIHFCTKEDTQKWHFLNGQIYREGTSLCLDSHKARVGLVISECEDQLESQQWTIASKGDQSRSRDEV